MKYTFLSLLFAIALFACNDADNDDRSTTDSTDVNKTDNSNQTATTTDTINRSLGDSANRTTSLDKDDLDFAKEMTENNYAEIKMAQLGQTKGTNAELKEIAKTLETDHTSALNSLKSAVGSKATLPAAETEKQREKAEKFSGKDAKEFDKDWCKEMMDAHDKSIDKLEKAQSRVKDADLKNWINQTLPVIRTHHDRLMACHKKLK